MGGRDGTTRRSMGPVLIGSVLVVLLLGSAVAAGFLGYRYWDGRATESARESSLAAAKEYAVDMFGYNAKNVSDHIDRSMNILTGAAKPEYDKTVTDASLAAEVRKQDIVSEVTIQDAGVVTNTRDTATVLLFINQSVTRNGNKEMVSINPSRLTYSMERSGDRWLVNGIDVITDESFRSKIDVGGSVPPGAKPVPGLLTSQSPTGSVPPALPAPQTGAPVPTP